MLVFAIGVSNHSFDDTVANHVIAAQPSVLLALASLNIA
jgi:hypothetical protein